MSALTCIIKDYSIKYDQKIKLICAPLVDYLKIPVFTYAFVEADGRFGYLTNSLDFNSYYFETKIFLQNPYFAHPALFRPGYAMLPCSVDKEIQKILGNRFQANHLFLNLKTNSHIMESFIFANINENLSKSHTYLTRLDLLEKFSRYFKREAKDLIGKIRADQFNIKTERGNELFESPTSLPLIDNDPKIRTFLKKITGLSPQELICLDHFKQGKSAQATAAIMNLSQRTVESYFENIKNKLECSSKYDLLNF